MDVLALWIWKERHNVSDVPAMAINGSCPMHVKSPDSPLRLTGESVARWGEDSRVVSVHVTRFMLRSKQLVIASQDICLPFQMSIHTGPSNGTRGGSAEVNAGCILWYLTSSAMSEHAKDSFSFPFFGLYTGFEDHPAVIGEPLLAQDN